MANGVVLLAWLLSHTTHTLATATPTLLLSSAGLTPLAVSNAPGPLTLMSVSNAQGESTETSNAKVPAIASAPAAKVEHASILGNHHVWFLMGLAVACLAAAIVRIEVGPAEQGAAQSLLVSEKDDLQKLLHLGFCAVALNISMLLWGISQEFVMSTAYSDAQGSVERVPSTLNVVFWNRVSTFLFSGLLLAMQGTSCSSQGILMSALPAASNAMASWCQYSSLQYISFALQTTAKTSKIAPVLIIDSLRGKPHAAHDYVEAFMLVTALVVFGFEVESARVDGAVTTMTGVMLLAGLIAADSLTPHCQDAMFTAHPEMKPIQATFGMAGFTCIAITLIQLRNGMFAASLAFLARHPDAVLHIAVLALSSTTTQYFITYTIKHHGPVVFTVVVSIRQVLSVGLSAVLFGHRLSSTALLAMTMVFGMVISRAFRHGNAQKDSINSPPPLEGQPLLTSAMHPVTYPDQPLQWPLAWLSAAHSRGAGDKKVAQPLDKRASMP